MIGALLLAWPVTGALAFAAWGPFRGFGAVSMMATPTLLFLIPAVLLTAGGYPQAHDARIIAWALLGVVGVPAALTLFVRDGSGR